MNRRASGSAAGSWLSPAPLCRQVRLGRDVAECRPGGAVDDAAEDFPGPIGFSPDPIPAGDSVAEGGEVDPIPLGGGEKLVRSSLTLVQEQELVSDGLRVRRCV